MELRKYEERPLLNKKEAAKYLGISMNLMNRIMKENEHTWVVRIGGRVFAHKKLLDKWIKGQVGVGRL